MISKRNPGHIKESKYQLSDKRFSKEKIKEMSSELNKLLSYSHKNEEDLKTFLDHNEKEQVKRCAKCEDNKPSSMSHCAKCNSCIYKYDHHNPWFNS